MKTEDILELLAKRGTMTGQDLRDATGESKNAISNHCTKLKRLGLVIVELIRTERGYSYAKYTMIDGALEQYKQTKSYLIEQRESKSWQEEVFAKIQKQKHITAKALKDTESIFSAHLWASISKANKERLSA